MRNNPVKRLRGGRRYFARLKERAATFEVDLGPLQWYDLWHQHFDWHEYAQRCHRYRRQHLEALFTAFRRVLQQASEAGRPVQVFVSIAPESEPGQDALYVHTPNPNGTPFPHSFERVNWQAAPPMFIRSFVDEEPWEVGALEQDGSTWWIVRAR